jgi:5-methyltetrahydrofolate--homocysteine methyltransferase
MARYDGLTEAVIKGDAAFVTAEVHGLLKEGAEPREILAQGLIGAMGTVGERFGTGDMFLPEVLMSADAVHQSLGIVEPLLARSGEKAMGSVVIGTVEGDIHDIGKRIVGFLIEGNGYRVIDLGVDVAAETFARAVAEHKPDIVGMSALLTTTMPNMAKTIDLLQQRGLREKTKIIVGGASVSEQFASSIGADGYAPDAASAVALAKRLVST